jgi:hypothetical protein
MKLKLEDLAPYLPYGLKYLDKDTNELTVMRSISTEINLIDMGWGNAHELKEFKPILRPLSDLTKQDNLVFNVEIYSGLINNIQNQETTQWGVWEYELLLKNHYDVFGLIEKGLAIDINTLK